MAFDVRASFPGESMAREARMKLMALRVDGIDPQSGALMSLTVDDEMMDRVATVIEQVGGVCEWE